MKDKCFISIPYHVLKNNLADIIARRFQPEIGLEGDILYTEDIAGFKKTSRALNETGLACTLHAPFFDLNGGALDRVIRQASRDKLKRAFDLLPVFRPRSIVCHLGYEDNKHSYKKVEWLKYSIETWASLLDIAAVNDTVLCLENTYERNAAVHQEILGQLNSSYAKLCLDVGHLSAFGKCRWQDWLPAMDRWLGQLHLHDNKGERDSHLAVGEGDFDFDALFDYLDNKQLRPIITLEPHHPGGAEKSLAALKKYPLFAKQ